MELKGLVVIGGVLCASCEQRNEDAERAVRAAEQATQAELDRVRALPPPTPEREPTFRVTSDVGDSLSRNAKENDVARKLEDAAMRAVYAHCSPSAASWREGSKLEGTLVFKSKGVKVERVNVSVELANKERWADGHTLWYMVTFDASGTPKTFEAKKEISARSCHLDAADQPYGL